MNYFLGLDGGGTKTAACILDARGTELGRGSGGPGNIASNEDTTLTASVRQALSTALAAANLPPDTRFVGVCAGVAGYSVRTRREAFRELLGRLVPADSHAVEPDYAIAYWGATRGEPGIVVIAGTGAVAFGRNAEGKTWKEDGLGYLLGDRGSGYQLGIQAVQHTLSQLRLGASSRLAEAVCGTTEAWTPEDLVEWVYRDFTPSRIAALAAEVCRLADEGEENARRLVASAASALHTSAISVAERLGLQPGASLYPLGGLWNSCPFLQERFRRCCHSRARKIESSEASVTRRFSIQKPKRDAVYGAAYLARRNALSLSGR